MHEETAKKVIARIEKMRETDEELEDETLQEFALTIQHLLKDFGTEIHPYRSDFYRCPSVLHGVKCHSNDSYTHNRPDPHRVVKKGLSCALRGSIVKLPPLE